MNKQKIIFIFVGIIVLGSLSLILLRDGNSTDSTATNLTQIRIGWQTPWATQGQLTQILKHTDILKNNNIVADFKGFSYGGPFVLSGKPTQIKKEIIVSLPKSRDTSIRDSVEFIHLKNIIKSEI